MSSKSSDLIQGTLEMLILKTLALEPMHGYDIALRIEQISKGVFRVNPGSLFPAFSRLERAGRIKAEWRTSENNRRAKYYVLTERGRDDRSEIRKLTPRRLRPWNCVTAPPRLLVENDSAAHPCLRDNLPSLQIDLWRKCSGPKGVPAAR
jgi:PadR family transcriptional regulator PadR